jgi:hypothetical protein
VTVAAPKRARRARRRAAGAEPARVGYDGRREIAEAGGRLVNVRHDPIAHMWARGRLSLAQKLAADEVRGLVEAIGLGSVRALDPTRERVDVSGRGHALTDRQLAAGRRLGDLARRIGADDAALVIRVCGYDEPLYLVAADWERDEDMRRSGGASQTTAVSVGARFKEALDRTAVFLRFLRPEEVGGRRLRILGAMAPGARPALDLVLEVACEADAGGGRA